MTIARYITVLVILFAFSIPLGGFVFGIYIANDDWSFTGILGRMFVGVLYAFLTTVFAGFPPRDESGGHSYNVWPIICIMFSVSFTIVTVLWLMDIRNSHRDRKNAKN